MPTYACCENAVCGYVAPSVTCVQLIPSTVLPLAPPATSPELLLHDDVPLVYQLMSPLTKPSSAVTTVEPLTGAVVGGERKQQGRREQRGRKTRWSHAVVILLRAKRNCNNPTYHTREPGEPPRSAFWEEMPTAVGRARKK